MAKSIEEGFRIFLRWITPSDTERAAASSHRAAIEAKLDARFGLYRMFESGSFRHGTGVSKHSDVDYFVLLKTTRPIHSQAILSSVREALKERFPSTYVHVARPAVVLEFGQGYERIEVIPAFRKGTAADGNAKFEIPGVIGEWLESSPKSHLKYVTGINSRPAIKSGAKGLARLTKAWKYY